MTMDRKLSRSIRAAVEGTNPDERMAFFDADYNLFEVVYPQGFEQGEHHRIRDRMEATNNLSAVVHISATVLGSRAGHGPRTSVVELCPSGEKYQLIYEPNRSWWQTKPDQRAFVAFDVIWKKGENQEET